MSENEYIIKITGNDGKIKETFDLNQKSGNFKLKGRNEAENFLVSVFKNNNIQKYKEDDIINLTIKFILYNINKEENASIENIINFISKSNLEIQNKIVILHFITENYIQKNDLNNLNKILLNYNINNKEKINILNNILQKFLNNNRVDDIKK